ncbi:MAG: hypothetical protein U1F83_07665 [Verrucomicrobiota bacterium]
MKRLLLMVGLAVFGCARSTRTVQEQTSVKSATPTAAPISEFVGAWVLNRAWSGYMGVAIKFDADGTFHYWFYSDARDLSEPKYPITGDWRWNGSVLELTASHHLHDVRWHPYSYHGEMCLLPEYAYNWQVKDGKEHADRLLFKIRDFDERQPFANRRTGD